MIDASKLDPAWIMDRIEEYHNGNNHIGKWQRYVEGRRWSDLAAKFTVDIQQLEKINSTIDLGSSRRCNIMSSIRNSKRQFFKRLDGAQDFELSETALRIEEGCNKRTSDPTPITSVSTVGKVLGRSKTL